MAIEDIAVGRSTEREANVAGRAWVVLAATCLATATACYALFAVPVLMPVIVADYRMEPGAAALAMSAFSVVGLALTMPAGWVMKTYGFRFVKHGIKLAAVLAMAAVVGGCIVAAVVSSFPLFLLGRVLQGAGLMGTALVGRTSVGLWFPPKKVAVALWLLSASGVVGGLVAMSTAPGILAVAGESAVWWTSATLALVALGAVAVSVAMPPWVLAAAGFFAASLRAPHRGRPSQPAGVYANRDVWLLAASACLVMLPGQATLALIGWYVHETQGPAFEVRALVGGAVMAGWLVGSAVGAASAPRARRPRLTLVVTAAAVTILVAVGFTVADRWLPVWAFLTGLVGLGLSQEAVHAALPSSVRGVGSVRAGAGVCALGIGLAAVVGPPLLGVLAPRLGWPTSGLALASLAALGLVTTLLIRPAHPRLTRPTGAGELSGGAT